MPRKKPKRKPARPAQQPAKRRGRPTGYSPVTDEERLSCRLNVRLPEPALAVYRSAAARAGVPLLRYAREVLTGQRPAPVSPISRAVPDSSQVVAP